MKIFNYFTRKDQAVPCDKIDTLQVLQKNIKEIIIMADYASGTGVDLKDPLPDQIADLALLNKKIDDVTRMHQGQNSHSEIEKAIGDEYKKNLSLSIQVHNQLSKLISPVTASSLFITQPGLIKHNGIIMVSILATIISLLLLIVLLFLSKFTEDDIALNYSSVIVAAILGAGVYNLYTARKYLIDRTFDPKYKPVYLVRLVLGIALGTILGLFGDRLGVTGNESGATGGADSDIISKLGPVVLAIVGAFSSDAVVSILQRIAETLQVVVKGSGESMVEFETEKAKNQEKNKATNQLLEIKSQIKSGTKPEELTSLIDKYVAE